MEPDPDATKLPDGDPDATRVPPGPDPGATLAGPDVASGGLAPGRLVFGRYTLAAEAGRGGMGVVWRARDEKLDRTVALKFLPEAVAADAEALRDLRRETRRCLDLTHPHIVRVYDLFEDGPLVAIAMEFIEGKSLAVRKSAAPAGCLGADELAPFVTQLCSALDYAHTQAKVVHRDLKPANLLVTRDGRLKVADFGIARGLSETHTRLTGKAGGGISGTLQYMSPQQLAGEKPTAGDDIYALGATLYGLLAGRPPFFRGDVQSLIKQIADTAPQTPTQRRLELELKGPPIPRAWEQTILACLAKDPAKRPPTAGEVAARLGLAGPAGSATPVKKSRAPLLAGLAALAALVVATAVFWSRGGLPANPVQPPTAALVRALERATIPDSALKPPASNAAATTPPPLTPEQESIHQDELKKQQAETTRQLVAQELARQLRLQEAKTRPAATPDNATNPQVGRDWTLSDLQLAMKFIAPGTFLMGSPADESDRSEDETQHKVTLTRGYWLGQTHVTQAQWAAMMGANPSHFQGDTLPVETVSWDYAMAFCRQLTERERAAGHLPFGYIYTLPTEAQWEYACRAGTSRAHAGDLDAIAWYYGNSDISTHPVGTKQPNAWGLFDMHGNAWEWCADFYGSYPAGEATDPTGPASGFLHVSRGGGCYSAAPVCRDACRLHDDLSNQHLIIGFRLALAPSPMK